MPDGLGLSEGPDRFACGRIDRHHLSPRCGHRVEHPIDVDRSGPGKVVDVGAEVIAPPNSRHLEVSEVAGVDLVQRRGARVADTPA